MCVAMGGVGFLVAALIGIEEAGRAGQELAASEG